MKRVRVAKGRHVMISAELAEKAQRVFESGLSREATRKLATSEPKLGVTLMAGSAKPLGLHKSRELPKKKSSTDSGI
jgi:hypothetical protein